MMAAERIPIRVMAEELEKLAWSKSTWLDNFAHGYRKRADHEIETRKRELAVLRQAAADYRAGRVD